MPAPGVAVPVSPPPACPPSPVPAEPARTGETAGLAGWVVVVAGALGWGAWRVADLGVSLSAAPLVGRWDWHGGRGLVPAAVLGVAAVAWGPRLARRLPWAAVPPAAGLAAALWAAALGASDGWSRLTAPLATEHEYEPLAATVRDLPAFLSTYVADLGTRPVHVQGHPPGPVVVAWGLDRIGLGGAGWLAVLVLAAWGGGAAAVLVAARAASGEAAARRSAPALVVLPAAIWAATSLDALFAGLIATAGALAVVAATRRSPAVALAAGVAWGAALACTYGAVPLLAIPAAVAACVLRPPRARLVVAGVAGALAVLALLAAAGFWWPDGLAATGAAYWAGIASRRPAAYLTVAGNPGALALATGPAVAAGIATTLAALAAAGRPRLPRGGHRRRDRAPLGVPVFVAAALAAVVAADLSQMSRGEVERIWLPFVPWLALAAPGDRRGWLGAQVGPGLALQGWLASPW